MNRSIIPMQAKQNPTVAVWTPWGVQSVPKQEGQTGALKRLAGRLASIPRPQAQKAMQA